VTQIYLNQQATTAPGASRVASAARAASFKRAYVNGMECFRDGRLLIVFPQRDTYGRCVEEKLS
jgi:hypothetical protein